MKQFSKLYKIDSKGKTRVYEIKIINSIEYSTSTGILNGSMVTKNYTPTAKGKNTVTEQVEKDAQSKWNKKYMRELYSQDLTKPHPLAFVQPMLAKDYTKIPHQVRWDINTYAAQRKLNGVRCVAQCVNNSVLLTSRKGKLYSVPHIEVELFQQVFYKNPALIIDAELYIHYVELGDVTHAVANAEEHLELEFHAFDLVDENNSFEIRHKQLEDLNLDNSLTCVDYELIENESDLYIAHDKFVTQGYEGVMLRDINSYYEKGKRSLSLFKRKVFQDDEFEIIGVDIDSEGGAILILQTKNKISFRSRPMGTNEYRKQLVADAKFIVGKSATAKYSTLLATGVPEFNRTIAIRDYE